MAHTNSTTNYELPQFIGTDKPAWLSDFNGAMNTIDATMKTNANNISTNTGNITSITNEIGDITSLETTNKTNIVSAINEVYNLFNLSDITTYTENSGGVSIIGGTLTTLNLTVACNSTKSICKIYGEVVVTGATTGNEVDITIPTNFPNIEQSFLVNPAGFRISSSASSVEDTATPNTNAFISFETNGKLTLGFKACDTSNYVAYIPFIIFVKDFGDVPNN